MEPTPIDKLTGVQQNIAKAIDDGDGKIEGKEKSIFDKAKTLLENTDISTKGKIDELKDF